MLLGTLSPQAYPLRFQESVGFSGGLFWGFSVYMLARPGSATGATSPPPEPWFLLPWARTKISFGVCIQGETVNLTKKNNKESMPKGSA